MRAIAGPMHRRPAGPAAGAARARALLRASPSGRACRTRDGSFDRAFFSLGFSFVGIDGYRAVFNSFTRAHHLKKTGHRSLSAVRLLHLGARPILASPCIHRSLRLGPWVAERSLMLRREMIGRHGIARSALLLHDCRNVAPPLPCSWPRRYRSYTTPAALALLGA